ncbi:hypothetical protein [Streptomyces ipomoeae]|uniref:hypothetical protein n=1 Tax=Streptomyces ipomoeae TaxID=103232 RepID=UPI001146317C|nr:hypothetical protein [Streptomyces ipomoeae]TQE35480.1 hypothetical protein Sipo7851_14560 [Streptomyces ipomoeae]
MAVSAFRGGQRMTADALNAMLARWTAWTPTWSTSSGSNTPSYGNATVDCKYAVTGDAVLFDFELTFGSTTSFGGGGTGDNWRFSLPVTAAEAQIIAGMGEIQGSSGAERYPVRARITTTTTFEIELSGRAFNNETPNSNGLIDAATPFGAANTVSTAWASGFAIRLHGHYQAA